MTAIESVGVASLQSLLLIEDDDGDAFIVEELLRDDPAAPRLIRARTLHDAMAVLSQGVDCVLMDLGLPDASGLEALRRTRAQAINTAVIVLTGLADEQRGVEAVAAGAQDYLLKGEIDAAMLTRSIRYAVERKQAELATRRLEISELRAAENARLEAGLLPQAMVDDQAVAVHARYRSGRDGLLGGDFFDVVEAEDHRLYLLIGDVSGHGTDEAALGVALRIGWRTLVLGGVPETEILPILDSLIVHERRFEEAFATVCMITVDPSRRSCDVFLAGHPAPLLLTDHAEQLPDNLVGPALGMLPGVTWGSRRLELPPQWRLFLFTDGLVEGRVGRGSERLGVDSVIQLAAASPAYADSEALIDDLIAQAQRLHGGPLTDDVAVVIVACR